MSIAVRAFVQARMSSRRFPGKVLAPFRGQPLIWHVVTAVERAVPWIPVVVVTSDHRSDDPLAGYLERVGFNVFRGPLDRVFDRFLAGAATHPCDWILRVNGDSPLLSPHVLQAVAGHAADTASDLITTVFPRTFPYGQNAELIRVRTMADVSPADLTAADQEHVTAFFYRNADRFRIVNLESEDPALAQLRLTVDTVEDLWRLEALESPVQAKPKAPAAVIGV